MTLANVKNIYKDKTVLIFGLGLNDGGLGMVDFFVNQDAKVTITDGKKEEELKPTLKKLAKYKDKITYHLGGHIDADFTENDIIVRNPAIKRDNPYLEIARKAKREIIMELALFHQLTPCPIIGITGTRGKSTTTTLIYEILKTTLGEKVLLGGNIGKSAMRELPKLTLDNLAVLEISSFQLDGMGESKVSPHIAVVTNLYPDHLNWHTDMQDYIETKKNIVRYQKPSDIAVINIDNEITKTFVDIAQSKVITFSLIEHAANYYLDKSLTLFENGKPLLSLKTASLEGIHNLYNMVCAIATTRIYDIPVSNILNVIESFTGVEGRQQLVRELNGIKIYNDTTATSLEAMEAMLDTLGPKYPKKIIMLAGGVDKGFDYSKLSGKFGKYLKKVILLEGTASEKLALELEKLEIPTEKYFNNFETAIKTAYKTAQPGDVMILCPGAASFNMFANEFDRGAKFNKVVEKLI
ncbi:UDP-N-acetylmuramoyl-L-alanine--D-glutamate ligase [Candidatus Dojkabacteria bacterium]|nr:UDP-N-acetylmuramoyl-L-alanine--D-glutamate ligase [Candidatus Dojkabacteria bacterium]